MLPLPLLPLRDPLSSAFLLEKGDRRHSVYRSSHACSTACTACTAELAAEGLRQPEALNRN